MFSRILVPLDGSERAVRALPVAARLARASGGALVLTQVLSGLGEFLPYVVTGIEPSTLSADLENATTYLQSLTTLPETKDIPAEVEVHTGQAPAKILEVARAHQVELIVLTSRGHTGLTRWALGNVAQKVARHAEMPVLLLHDEGALPAGPHPEPERPLRALVALDGSPAAEEALGPAIQTVVALAAPGPAAVHLFQVAPPGADLEPSRAYLKGQVEQVHAAQPPELKLEISWSVARDQDVAGAIARTAETGESAEGAAAPGGCDLIALTTYGASGRQAWALGGVAERVVGSSKLPLLVVRPAEAGEAGAGE
jgi:nucleotide-binding universal stress UspA family protein